VRPQTVYRWFRQGTLPVPAVRVNERTVLVSPDVAAGESNDQNLWMSLGEAA
jgi:putative resolvase